MKKVNNEDMHQYTEDGMVTIEGKDSKYVAKPSVHEKARYSRTNVPGAICENVWQCLFYAEKC